MPDDDVLHEDAPDATATGPDGRPVRNLTATEYAATYAEGTGGHLVPPNVIADIEAQLDAQDAGL